MITVFVDEQESTLRFIAQTTTEVRYWFSADSGAILFI